MALMHQTLESVLFDAVKDQSDVRFDTTITALESDDKGVHVKLDDGSQLSCDVLVGADGIHSSVRALVFGGEDAFLWPLGYCVASYRVSDRYQLGPTWTMYLEPGHMVGLYAGDAPGSAFAFFMFETTDRLHVPRAERVPRLQREFEGVGWITRDLLDDAPDGDDVFMDTVAQIQIPRWHEGRVALVGDACDCPTLVKAHPLPWAEHTSSLSV